MNTSNIIWSWKEIFKVIYQINVLFLRTIFKENCFKGLALVEQYFGLEAVGLGEYKRYVEGVERLANRRPVDF